MPYKYQEMSGPDGLRYGYEWCLDALDTHIDRLLPNSLWLPIESLPRTAVEIGCGTGLRAASLASSGLFERVIAIDISDHSQDIASRNRLLKKSATAGQNIPQIEFRQTSVTELDCQSFADVDVAFVECRRVLHFLPSEDVRKAFGNIQGFASEGALVCISIDNCTYLNGRSFYDHSRQKAGLANFCAYAGEDIRSLIAQFSFQLPESLAFQVPLLDIRSDDEPFRKEENAFVAVAPGPNKRTLTNRLPFGGPV